MSVGPLRRLSGAVGLLAMAPIALMLATGQISVADAAVRAAITLAAVLVLARLARSGMAHMAATLEAAAPPGQQGQPRPPAPATDPASTPNGGGTETDEAVPTPSEVGQASPQG